MKHRSFLFACALFGAAPVFADVQVDAAKLGRMEGVLAACSGVTPQIATQYLLQIKATIGSASKDDVASARNEDAYREEYEAVQQSVSNLSPEGLADACGGYLTTAR